MKTILMSILFASFITAHAQTVQIPAQKPQPRFYQKSDCGDFLAKTGKKPAQLTFEKCTTVRDRQGKPLVATYSVRGVHAAAVETWLVKRAGLVQLKRSCCQWDSSAGGFSDKAGRKYQIKMVSSETTVRERKNWRKIEQFEITVEAFTEEI